MDFAWKNEPVKFKIDRLNKSATFENVGKRVKYSQNTILQLWYNSELMFSNMLNITFVSS